MDYLTNMTDELYNHICDDPDVDKYVLDYLKDRTEYGIEQLAELLNYSKGGLINILKHQLLLEIDYYITIINRTHNYKLTRRGFTKLLNYSHLQYRKPRSIYIMFQ